MRYRLVPAGTPVKSTMTSARSATPIRSDVNGTGAGSRPPSVPMTQIGRAAAAGRAAVGLVATFSSRTRVLHALSRRSRYRRASTLKNGPGGALRTTGVPEKTGVPRGGGWGGGGKGAFGGGSPEEPRLARE